MYSFAQAGDAVVDAIVGVVDGCEEAGEAGEAGNGRDGFAVAGDDVLGCVELGLGWSVYGTRMKCL